MAILDKDMSVLDAPSAGSELLTQTMLLQNDADTPLGRLRLAALIRNGRGVQPERPLRVYGSYAVVCIFNGRGNYRDSSGIKQEVHGGDVIFVFPERPHWYGPRRGERWDELYLVFDGRIFDLYRSASLLNDKQPVVTAPAGWSDRLLNVVSTTASSCESRRQTHIRRILDLCGLLRDISAYYSGDAAAAGDDAFEASTSTWLSRARRALEIDLGRPTDLRALAADVGVSYERFRKQFQREVGVSPAHYRMERRIDGARELLRYSPQMTNRQVAQTLGFADEFHFSRRFKQLTGLTPRDWRGKSWDGPPRTDDATEDRA